MKRLQSALPELLVLKLSKLGLFGGREKERRYCQALSQQQNNFKQRKLLLDLSVGYPLHLEVKVILNFIIEVRNLTSVF